jgi:hypothetical protein
MELVTDTIPISPRSSLLSVDIITAVYNLALVFLENSSDLKNLQKENYILSAFIILKPISID